MLRATFDGTIESTLFDQSCVGLHWFYMKGPKDGSSLLEDKKRLLKATTKLASVASISGKDQSVITRMLPNACLIVINASSDTEYELANAMIPAVIQIMDFVDTARVDIVLFNILCRLMNTVLVKSHVFNLKNSLTESRLFHFMFKLLNIHGLEHAYLLYFILWILSIPRLLATLQDLFPEVANELLNWLVSGVNYDNICKCCVVYVTSLSNAGKGGDCYSLVWNVINIMYAAMNGSVSTQSRRSNVLFWELLNNILQNSDINKAIAVDQHHAVSVHDIEHVIGRNSIKTLEYLITLRRQCHNIPTMNNVLSTVKVCNTYKEYKHWMRNSAFEDLIGQNSAMIASDNDQILLTLISDTEEMIELLTTNIKYLLDFAVDDPKFLQSLQIVSVCANLIALLPATCAQYTKVMNRLAFFQVQIKDKQNLEYLSM